MLTLDLSPQTYILETMILYNFLFYNYSFFNLPTHPFYYIQKCNNRYTYYANTTALVSAYYRAFLFPDKSSL